MDPSWRQLSICFDGWDTAEQTAITHLAPLLADAESTGQVTSWFFIRKNPCWRLRFLPSSEECAQDVTTALHQQLDILHRQNEITRWIESIYEPETHAFGGAGGMDTAHYLFHQDSRNVLAYLAATPAGGDRRRELSVLLCSLLLRAAGQDWYEQGDIWARVAEHRTPPNIPPDRQNAMRSDLRRLMTADTTSLTRDHGRLAHLANWALSYHTTGTVLRDMAAGGTLRRGLRAVLAHHVIFAWNRIGLNHTTQSLLAYTAKAVVLDQ